MTLQTILIVIIGVGATIVWPLTLFLLKKYFNGVQKNFDKIEDLFSKLPCLIPRCPSDDYAGKERRRL
jgi:hypothetical protein